MVKILTVEDLKLANKTLLLPPEALKPTDENLYPLGDYDVNRHADCYIKFGLASNLFPKGLVEYPWGSFQGIQKGMFRVIIGNDLVHTQEHGYKCGDLLLLSLDQILAIMY